MTSEYEKFEDVKWEYPNMKEFIEQLEIRLGKLLKDCKEKEYNQHQINIERLKFLISELRDQAVKNSLDLLWNNLIWALLIELVIECSTQDNEGDDSYMNDLLDNMNGDILMKLLRSAQLIKFL